jgi:hypothetical protein
LHLAVDIYLQHVADPPSCRGQAWPSNLLPITRWDQGHDCIDLVTGRMVCSDEEELANGSSDRVGIARSSLGPIR